MFILVAASNQVDTVDTGQLLACPPGIAAGSHYEDTGVAAIGLSQTVACFTVGGMGYGAGIEDVDISLTDVCDQFIPDLNQLSCQKLCLCLV